MKKIFNFLAALLLLLINGASQAQVDDGNNSLLWKVSGNGLTSPSYVFGTIHLICADDYVWTKAMKESLAASEKLCLELDLDDMNVMMKAQTGLMDMTGKKLSEYFTDEQYKLLSDYMNDSIGIQMMLLEMMKPIALQMLMASRVTYCDSPTSYEEKIMSEVKQDGKEVVGLESPDEQIKALESIPVDSIVNSIMESIQSDNSDRDEYSKMVAAFKSQNLAELYNIIQSSGDEGLEAGALLYDRNERWIGRMKELMGKSSVFFAVGAGHLAGERGVLELLRKQGYEVVPLK